MNTKRLTIVLAAAALVACSDSPQGSGLDTPSGDSAELSTQLGITLAEAQAINNTQQPEVASGEAQEPVTTPASDAPEPVTTPANGAPEPAETPVNDLPLTSTRSLQGVWTSVCTLSAISNERGEPIYYWLSLSIGASQFSTVRSNWIDQSCSQPYQELKQQKRSGSLQIDEWITAADSDRLHLSLQINSDYVDKRTATADWVELRDNSLLLGAANSPQQFRRH